MVGLVDPEPNILIDYRGDRIGHLSTSNITFRYLLYEEAEVFQKRLRVNNVGIEPLYGSEGCCALGDSRLNKLQDLAGEF